MIVLLVIVLALVIYGVARAMSRPPSFPLNPGAQGGNFTSFGEPMGGPGFPIAEPPIDIALGAAAAEVLVEEAMIDSSRPPIMDPYNGGPGYDPQGYSSPDSGNNGQDCQGSDSGGGYDGGGFDGGGDFGSSGDSGGF